jgi:hypothetical protein
MDDDEVTEVPGDSEVVDEVFSGMVEMMVASEPPVHSCNGERRRLEMLR